jgi:ketosteroid isomerase-like protein
MATHPNVDLIRRGFDAFNAADMAGLAELLDENASQHMAGANPVFSGDHHGRDNLFAMYGRLGEESGGTFRADLEHVWANDDTAVALYRATADRDGKHLDMRNVLLFSIVNSKVTKLVDIPDDVGEQDAFWS